MCRWRAIRCRSSRSPFAAYLNYSVKLTSYVFCQTRGTDIGRPVRHLPRPFEVAHRPSRCRSCCFDIFTALSLRVMSVPFPEDRRLEKRFEGKHVKVEIFVVAISSQWRKALRLNKTSSSYKGWLNLCGQGKA